jgi:hypothetical protein
MPTPGSHHIPAAGPHGKTPRDEPPQLILGAGWPTSRMYRWRSRMPERPAGRAVLSREIHDRVYQAACDYDHETITPIVINKDQKVISTIGTGLPGRPGGSCPGPAGPVDLRPYQICGILAQSGYGNTAISA